MTKFTSLSSSSSLFTALLFFVYLAAPSFGLVRQITSFHEIDFFPHDSPNETLLLFDIDNTLMHPVSDLGSDQWFYCLYQALGRKPLEDHSLDFTLLQAWNKVQDYIQVQPSEENLPEWVRMHQERGVQTMALTARSKHMLDVSIRQLKSIGIHLASSSQVEVVIPKEELSGVEDAHYAHGVLAIGESNVKAHALSWFLRNLSPLAQTVKRIIFVDDKQYHVDAMDQLQITNVVIDSFRYGKLDQRVQDFTCNAEEALRYV